MTRRERLERKLDRRQEWAGKARGRGDSSIESASEIGSRIPFGQPILVGHHSEARARRDADRIQSGMRKGVELHRKADHHESKARGLESQLKRSVFSDDADAIEKLEKRIAKNEAAAKLHNAINRQWRKSKGTVAEKATALVSSGVCSQTVADAVERNALLVPWMADKPMDATNLRARIRADKKRIAEVKTRQERSQKAEEAESGIVFEHHGENWVAVTFAEKPERETINALKESGFRWQGGSWHGHTDRLPEGLE